MKIIKRLLLFALLSVMLACSRSGGVYKDTRVIMGTYVTITASLEGVSEDKAREAVGAAFAEVDRVDTLMSTYKPESQLSLINKNAGVAPVKADPEVLSAIKDALEISRLTGGAFDATVGPLVRLWKIGGEGARLPGAKDIARAKALVDYRQVEVDEEAGTIFIRKKGMSVDLGAIAKGYAADLAVDAMVKRGIRGGIVAVAGDIKAFGLRPDGTPWKVGVQHPRQKDAVIAKAELGNDAISTSGDYERYFIKDGVRYHHIMDPATGYPAKGLVSVTVIAKESWRADATATGLFVMGPERARTLAAAAPGLEALLIDDKGAVFSTGRFKNIKLPPLDIGPKR